MRRMSSCFTPTSIVLAAVLPLIAASAEAQPSDGSADPVRSVSPPAVGSSAGPRVPTEVAAMRAELARLYEEVDALRASVTEMRAAMGLATQGQPPAHPAPAQPPQVTPETVDVLRAQIEEQAQTKVESSSRLPVKISGTILSNTFVNSAGANWLENPNLAGTSARRWRASRLDELHRSQSRSAWRTRASTSAAGRPAARSSPTSSAALPDSQTGTVMGLPRLCTPSGGSTTNTRPSRVGQDHAVLAPRDPTSLAAFSFPLLFRAGNLYLRVPQARVEQKLTAELVARGGHRRAGRGRHRQRRTSSRPWRAPANARNVPAFEARFGLRPRRTRRRPRAPGRRLRALRLASSRDRDRPRRGQSRSTSTRTSDGLAPPVRYFTADNAEPFGGGISQPGRSSGGWAEGRVLLTATTRAVGGWGQDRPTDARRPRVRAATTARRSAA